MGTGWAMLVWAIVAMAMDITWDMLDTTATTLATMARGRPKLNQLPKLMLKLPQRLILGYASHPYGYGYYGHHLGYAGYAGYYPYAYHGGCRNGYGAHVPCAGK